LLNRLHRDVAGPFTVEDTARILSLDPARARRLLAHLASQGWLARVRRGLYSVVPLGASGWHEDPWVVATKLFTPCYIAGWSAAEHWDLTEQIFREVVVITTTPVRHTRLVVQDTPYRLKFADAKHLFGTAPAWRGTTKVLVSDPSRTVVDLLADPAIGGGIRHVTQILRSYFSSEHRDDRALVRYATRLGNRAVFKRLGFLTELLRIEAPALIKHAMNHKSAGLSFLDPSIRRRGRILKRWNLRVNADLDEEAA
jgi:predicted transcriptional regulator of viral defense system